MKYVVAHFGRFLLDLKVSCGKFETIEIAKAERQNGIKKLPISEPPMGIGAAPEVPSRDNPPLNLIFFP